MDTENENQIEFSAPIDAGATVNDIDCGMKCLPCLSDRLMKYANSYIYVTVLTLCGFCHGIVLYYFRSTSQLWGEHYGISRDITDWLIYVNEFFIGVFALFISFWGSKTHRPVWIGATTMLMSILALCLAIPEFYKPFESQETNLTRVEGTHLCEAPLASKITVEENSKDYRLVTFIIVIIYQIFHAMNSISYISHGISYIDDNFSSAHSPSYIGIALAGIEVGKQVGTYFSWFPTILNMNSYHSIFLSPVWFILSAVTFVGGFIMMMFPKILPTVMIQKISASILDLAAGNEFKEESEHPGFLKIMGRIFTNNIIIVNTISLVILQSALINFKIFEDYYHQARFSISIGERTGFNDHTIIQYTTNLLTQPLVAVGIFITGIFISKFHPKAKSLVIWNIVILILCVLFFGSTRFWSCNNTIEPNNPAHLCNSACNCLEAEPYNPVCLDGKIYYSPCIAGCRKMSNSSNGIEYTDCLCGQDTRATSGTCNSNICNLIFGLSEVNNVFTSGLLATTLMTNIIITLRAVQPKEKATVIGFQATLLGLMPYLPFKALYGFIVDKYCLIRTDNTCTYYKEDLATFMSATTLVCMVISALLSFLLLCFVNNLELYETDNVDEAETNALVTLEMRNMSKSKEKNEQYKRNSGNKVNGESSESLREFASTVGDDHDSISED